MSDDWCIVHKPLEGYGGAAIWLKQMHETFGVESYTTTNTVPDKVPSLQEFGESTIGNRLPYSVIWRYLRYRQFDPPATKGVITSGDVAVGAGVGNDLKHVHWITIGPGIFEESFSPDDPLYWNARKYLARRWQEQADLVLANSEYCKEAYENLFDVTIDGVAYPGPKRDRFSLHEGESDNYFFYYGQLNPGKHVDLLLEAFGGTDEQLYIAGSGATEQMKSKAADNIHFLGFLEKSTLEEYIQRAKAVVFMSKTEPFGRVPIESMLCGTPVIAYHGGFQKHQITPDLNGKFYHDFTPRALREEIESFDEDDFTPKEVRESSYPYTWEDCQEQWADAMSVQ